MKPRWLILLMIVGLLSIVSDIVYGVTFTDSTGYIPHWAIDIGEQQALMRCLNIEYETPDGNWCLEFTGYLLDNPEETLDESSDLANPDYVPQFDYELFDEKPKEVPSSAYVNQLYNFAIVPPSKWSVTENSELIGGEEAAPVAFYSSKMHPTYSANFIIVYQNFGSSYFDLLRFTSDEQFLDDFVTGLTSTTINAKVNHKNIESYVDGYKLTVQFAQTVKADEKKFVTLQRETIAYVLESGEIYFLNFAATPEDFDSEVKHFRKSSETFHVGSVNLIKTTQAQSSAQPAANEERTQQESSGCLIATATFGSELAPQVQFLREIRDNTILSTASGTSFMTAFNVFYYSFSPTVADLERQNPIFKETVKIAIMPLLSSLLLLQYVDIDSETQMLGYGIGIILLNVGMYFVAPTVILLKIKEIQRKKS